MYLLPLFALKMLTERITPAWEFFDNRIVFFPLAISLVITFVPVDNGVKSNRPNQHAAFLLDLYSKIQRTKESIDSTYSMSLYPPIIWVINCFFLLLLLSLLFYKYAYCNCAFDFIVIVLILQNVCPHYL